MYFQLSNDIIKKIPKSALTAYIFYNFIYITHGVRPVHFKRFIRLHTFMKLIYLKIGRHKVWHIGDCWRTVVDVGRSLAMS